jgi:hypothetical protein
MMAFAVVANDAGAANLLFSILREQGKKILGEVSLHPVLSGPAAALWPGYFPEVHTYESIQSIEISLDAVITGTGWSSDIEHKARIWGAKNNLKTIAVIDHWTNYAERFVRAGKRQLPDEIWVVDKWAQELATNAFPSVEIREFENSYLNLQLRDITPAPKSGTLLYVLEPVRSDWGLDKQGEFQALDYLLQHVDTLWPDAVHRIILRPHPSDPVYKYHHYLSADTRIEIDMSNNLSQAINQADVVVGVETFAMTLALAAGRSVFSSLPPWAPELRLPHEGIQQIRQLCPK